MRDSRYHSTALQLLLLVLGLAASGLALARLDHRAPAEIESAVVRLEFNLDLLAAWGISAASESNVEDAGEDAPPASPGYLRFASRLRAKPAAVDVFEPESAFTLRAEGCDCEVVLAQLQARSETLWLLGEAEASALLEARMPHLHRLPSGALRLEHFDLVATAALATALQRPKIEGQVIGRLAVDLPVEHAQARLRGKRDCRPELQFPAPGESVDVALIDISAVQALRCAGPVGGDGQRPACSAASSDGRVVIAPAAELANVGTNDVPWFVKFFPAAPPYGNDQHPFLIWSVYRIGDDGRLDPLGESPIKHAFYAQNNDCDCVGDFILYRGCSDVYGVGTNDIDDVLGPRRELAPAERIWGRCGSIYDADCDAQPDPEAQLPDRIDGRLAVAETELQTAGARYWLEAWYLARDDASLDNSLGHVEFVAEKQDAVWLLSRQGEFHQGSLLSRWRSQPGAVQSALLRLPSPDGQVDLAVRVVALPSGDYRYDYVLKNYDHAVVQLEGAPPNQRLLSSRGPQRLEVTLPVASSTFAPELAQSAQGLHAWELDHGPEHLAASAPAIDEAGWGRLLRLSVQSQLGPGQGMARLVLGAREVQLPVPVPAFLGVLFVDGFE